MLSKFFSDNKTKFIIFIFFVPLILYIIGLKFSIINPFDMGTYLLTGVDTSIIGIIFSYIVYIIITFTIFYLIKLSFSHEIKIKVVLFYLFIFGYLIRISISLYQELLFNPDSASHLFIIRKIMIEGYSADFDPYISQAYTLKFFHIFFAILSSLTGINPHLLIRFIPQLIYFSFFFIGLYKWIFDYLKIKSKKGMYIFVLVLFHPFNYVLLQSYMGPFYFVISLTPLILYFIFTISKKNSIKNIIYIVLLSFFTIASHILGILLFFYILIAIIIRKFFIRNLDSNVNSGLKPHLFNIKNYLKLIWIVMVIFAVIILFKDIFTDFLRILLELVSLDELIINKILYNRLNLNIGPIFFNSPYLSYNLLRNSFHVYSIIFTFICNNLYYIWTIKKKRVFERNQLNSLRLLHDFSFPFIVLSWFFGISVELVRFVMYIYFICYFFTIFYLLKMIKWLEKFIQLKCKKMIFSVKWKNMDIAFFIFLFISIIIPFAGSMRPYYRNAHYETMDWINLNLPEDSLFLTDRDLQRLVSGLTLRDAIFDSGVLFDENYSNDEELRIISFMRPLNISSILLLIDLQTLESSKNHTIYYSEFPTPLVDIGGINYLEHSSYYNLLYNQSDILIYQLDKP